MEARYLAAGDTALVVEFGDAVDRETSEKVHLSRGGRWEGSGK